MGDTADFTFCQVNKMDDVLESPKTIPDTSQNHIVKNQSDGLSMNKLSNSIQGIAAAATTSTASEESRPEKQDCAKTVDGLIKLEEPVTARKPKARAKVPFEKGYSQMDWLKVTRTHPDLAGLKGKSNRRLISLDEVKKHKSGDSIWTVLKGRVYNISPYVKFHPGGVDMIMQTAGKDCTSLFSILSLSLLDFWITIILKFTSCRCPLVLNLRHATSLSCHLFRLKHSAYFFPLFP